MLPTGTTAHYTDLATVAGTLLKMLKLQLAVCFLDIFPRGFHSTVYAGAAKSNRSLIEVFGIVTWHATVTLLVNSESAEIMAGDVFQTH